MRWGARASCCCCASAVRATPRDRSAEQGRASSCWTPSRRAASPSTISSSSVSTAMRFRVSCWRIRCCPIRCGPRCASACRICRSSSAASTRSDISSRSSSPRARRSACRGRRSETTARSGRHRPWSSACAGREASAETRSVPALWARPRGVTLRPPLRARGAVRAPRRARCPAAACCRWPWRRRWPTAAAPRRPRMQKVSRGPASRCSMPSSPATFATCASGPTSASWARRARPPIRAGRRWP